MNIERMAHGSGPGSGAIPCYPRQVARETPRTAADVPTIVMESFGTGLAVVAGQHDVSVKREQRDGAPSGAVWRAGVWAGS